VNPGLTGKDASASTTPSIPAETPGAAPAPAVAEKSEAKSDAKPEAKSGELPAEKPATKPVTPAVVDAGISPKAAEYKKKVDAAVAELGLAGRAKVQAVGNSLTLAGKLRPSEHSALLRTLRDAPADVRVIDHIEYDDTPAAKSTDPDDASHPVPEPDRGAIHVVTDVIGATATLFGPAGKQLRQCQTPCSFNGLVANRFSLEVREDGYRTIQTALQVKAGEVVDQKLSLESLSAGLLVVSDPPGADVWINGAKQSGKTPVVLPLAAGQFNLVLKLQGYANYSAAVQVKDNVQTEVSAQLHLKDAGRMAWADVTTNPAGAEIVVDGTTTSQFSPSRVQVSAGIHTITLKMKGFQPARQTVEVTEGGTVHITQTLKPSK
jgi:hypothetical protein